MAAIKKNLEKKEHELCVELKKLAENKQECGQQLEQLHLSLKEVQNRAEAVRKNMDSMNQCLTSTQGATSLTFFAGKEKRKRNIGAD